MKRFLALLISVLMALSLVTIPVFAENTDHETAKVNPGSAVAVKPNDAETLDEALNVPGGTLTFVSDGDYPWEIYEDGARSTNMGVSNSESSVKTTVEATEGGEVLQFDFMSFGEGGSYLSWHLIYNTSEIVHPCGHSLRYTLSLLEGLLRLHAVVALGQYADAHLLEVFHVFLFLCHVFIFLRKDTQFLGGEGDKKTARFSRTMRRNNHLNKIQVCSTNCYSKLKRTA